MLFIRKGLQLTRSTLQRSTTHLHRSNHLTPGPLRAIPTHPFSSMHRDDLDLVQITSILKTPLLRINSEIGDNIMVRLLDHDTGKYIGTMKLEEAVKYSQSKGKDVVLHNAKVRPVLCKAFNYRSHLYTRFIKEILQEDIIMKKKYEKKKELLVESEKLRLNISQHDMKNKLARYFKRRVRIKEIHFRMEVRGHQIDEGIAVFSSLKTLAKDFLKPLNRVDYRNTSSSDYDQEEDIELDEEDSEELGRLENEDENFRVTKQDYIDKRRVNREGKYLLTQIFEVFGVERKEENTHDPDFTDKELREMVKEYFNQFKNNITMSEDVLKNSGLATGIQVKSERQLTIEKDISKKKKVQFGRETAEGKNTGMQARELREKNVEMTSETVGKGVVGADDEELTPFEEEYEKIRGVLGQEKGVDADDEDQMREFIIRESREKMSYLDKFFR